MKSKIGRDSLLAGLHVDEQLCDFLDGFYYVSDDITVMGLLLFCFDSSFFSVVFF